MILRINFCIKIKNLQNKKGLKQTSKAFFEAPEAGLEPATL